MCWKAAKEGCWKLNCDATARGGIAYLVVAAQNHDGQLAYARSDYVLTNNSLVVKLRASSYRVKLQNPSNYRGGDRRRFLGHMHNC